MSENVELVKRGYEAFNGGDLEAVFERFDPKIEWITDERVPLAGTYHGHDEVRRLLRDQQEVFGQLTMEPYEFFESGDQVVAFVRQVARGQASGAEIEITIGHLWTIRNGKAVRWRVSRAREGARGRRVAATKVAPARLIVGTHLLRSHSDFMLRYGGTKHG